MNLPSTIVFMLFAFLSALFAIYLMLVSMSMAVASSGIYWWFVYFQGMSIVVHALFIWLLGVRHNA